MRRTFVRRRLPSLVAGLSLLGATATAWATPAIVMDATTGDVLYAQDATQPWYPASTTKLMTVYVALSAVRDRKIGLDTPLVVSARARAMPPSKMGFAIGTQVTLDNALKMLMVRSANDIAVTIAEGVSGSVEAFADDMNQAAAELGLRESHFVNPNGLPSADHVSSARDMALIARGLYAQFPDRTDLYNIGTLAFGQEMIQNHNNLLGRYPGVDGMKTGFTCAAGFNVVASAFRNGRRLVVVVMGAPTVATRTAKVAALLDRAYAGIDRPMASILAMPASATGGPLDMHDQVCRGGRGASVARFNAEVEQLDAPLMTATANNGLGSLNPERALLFSTQANVINPTPSALTINSLPAPTFPPVPVHIGAEPGYAGLVAQARTPHSPIGSEPEPVTAAAYAAEPPGQPQNIGNTPLKVDATALPLKGRHTKTARAQRSRATTRAAAQAPKTKVIADAAPREKAAEVKVPAAKKTAARPAMAKATLQAKVTPQAKDTPQVKLAGRKQTAAPKPAPAKKLKSARGE